MIVDEERPARRSSPDVARVVLHAILGVTIATAAGVAGLFMETHPDPAKALSDGPNAWPLGRMRELLETLKEIDTLVKRTGFAEAKK